MLCVMLVVVCEIVITTYLSYHYPIGTITYVTDPALPPLTHSIASIWIIMQARLASNREVYVIQSHCTASAMQIL